MDTQSRVNQAAIAAAKERLQSPQSIQQPRAARSAVLANATFIIIMESTGRPGEYSGRLKPLYAEPVTITTQGSDAKTWFNRVLYPPFDPNCTVLNLHENSVRLSNTEPGLALQDLLMAWQVSDTEGNVRWVGIPLHSGVRYAKAVDDAPATNYITCNLILADGREAWQSIYLGYHIKVYVNASGASNYSQLNPRTVSYTHLTLPTNREV